MNAHIAAQMRIRIHNITAAGEVDRQFLCIHAFSALPWGAMFVAPADRCFHYGTGLHVYPPAHYETSYMKSSAHICVLKTMGIQNV